jgi:hypothetical protein
MRGRPRFGKVSRFSTTRSFWAISIAESFSQTCFLQLIIFCFVTNRIFAYSFGRYSFFRSAHEIRSSSPWRFDSICFLGRYVWRVFSSVTCRATEPSGISFNFFQHLTFSIPVHILKEARGIVVVKAMCYKPGGCGFETRWGEWNFSIYLILPATIGPWQKWEPRAEK